MKKLFFAVLFIALFMPLHAEEDWEAKNRVSFARRDFEFGLNFNAGLANNLLGINEILTENIVINLNQLSSGLNDDGAGIGLNAFVTPFYLNIKNLPIGGGRWGIGFFTGVDFNGDFNIPKSLFIALAEGNTGHPVMEGEFSVRGAAYAETGMSITAAYNTSSGRRLQIGVTPAVFSPLLVVPRSGISYRLDTRDGVLFAAGGTIEIFGPLVATIDDNGQFEPGNLAYGFDISLNGQYSLSSFLDIGASLGRIPIVASAVQNRLRLTMQETTFLDLKGQDVFDGNDIKTADVEFDQEFDIHSLRVFRPLRFDVFARLKPFSTETLVLRPNIGFTFDINDGEPFFNAGLETRLNLRDLFIPYIYTGREEGLWLHRAGLIFNLRVFEVSLEAALQSQTFAKSFQGSGFRLGVGIAFGW